MKKVSIHLHDEPFRTMQNGTKTIEMRLYDEKRRAIQIGDELEFTNRVTGEIINTEVINLYVFKNFQQVYERFDKVKLGYREDQEANYKDMERFYSKEEQDKYGVVAIEVKLINK